MLHVGKPSVALDQTKAHSPKGGFSLAFCYSLSFNLNPKVTLSHEQN